MRSVAIGCACIGAVGLSGCFGRPAHSPRAEANASIGVNAYLWRATLDTLAFMPLQSADPFGGVVVTDWYANPERPTERFKVTVYILDSRLRADGISVSVFKQVSDGAGGWANSPVSEQTATDFENSILTKARQLRLSNLQH
ncbi:MAG TPA: DUF3576 domain-containing protein [Caulobacteraceae bacterium]|nr:DUF3576 domain-containing protein [Caulobacteraceae bacterium]